MTGIYDGLRVLEISDVKGMYCGKVMAQFGAEVIKIERPGGDYSRSKGPFAPGEENRKEKSLSFAYLNTGKKDITLDIETKEGQKIFKDLVKVSDVLIETLKPGEMDSLNIGYETLKEINKGIIVVSITPFGQDGCHSKWRASTDIIPDAMGGCMPDVGYLGRGPLHLGYDIMTSVCGLYGAFAIQAAYHNRLSTGMGTHIDISQQEAFSIWRSSRLGEAQLAHHDFPLLGGEGYVRQGLVDCKDGFAQVMLGVKFKELVKWFEDEGMDIEVFKDPKYDEFSINPQCKWDGVLLEYFNELGSKYTKTEFMEEAQRRKIPACALESADTILDNCQLNARDYFVEIDHPVIGKYKYPGCPAKMSESELIVNKPAPLLGADNDEIYKNLGISDHELAGLKEQKII